MTEPNSKFIQITIPRYLLGYLIEVIEELHEEADTKYDTSHIKADGIRASDLLALGDALRDYEWEEDFNEAIKDDDSINKIVKEELNHISNNTPNKCGWGI